MCSPDQGIVTAADVVVGDDDGVQSAAASWY